MGRGAVKRIAKLTATWLWRAFAVACTLIGISGIPGDLETWAKWIDIIVNDPLVQALAAVAVDIAEFINLWPVRTALVTAGILMMIWPLRWFWRIRHRLRFLWRSALAEKVWISEEMAKHIMKDSAWGQLKAPTFTRSIGKGFFEGLLGSPGEIVSGLSERQKTELKFNTYITLALKRFCESNPDSVREHESRREVDEVALTLFLDHAVRECAVREATMIL